MKMYATQDHWLGRVMGKPAWKVGKEVPGDSIPLQEAIKAGSEQFFYAKVDVSQAAQVAYLESMGLHVVDTNVQLSLAVDDLAGPGATEDQIGVAMESEAADVVELARKAFSTTRFHLDPNISEETANAIKAEWVANYFKGQRGDRMIVGRVDGKVEGFLLILDQPDTLVIDLIAVSEAARRRGLGWQMIQIAVKTGPQVKQLLVGTQIANIASIRFYERLGFRFHKADYVLHATM